MADNLEFGLKIAPDFTEFDSQIGKHKSKETIKVGIEPDTSSIDAGIRAYNKTSRNNASQLRVAISPVEPADGLQKAVDTFSGKVSLRLPIKPVVSTLRSDLNAAVAKLSGNGSSPIAIEASIKPIHISKTLQEAAKGQLFKLPVTLDINQSTLNSQIQSIQSKIVQALGTISVTPQINLNVKQSGGTSNSGGNNSGGLSYEQTLDQAKMLTQLEDFQRKYQSVLQSGGANTVLGDELQSIIDKVNQINTGDGLTTVKHEVAEIEARVKSLAGAYRDASSAAQYMIKSSTTTTSDDWLSRWSEINRYIRGLDVQAQELQSDFQTFSLPQKFVDDLKHLASAVSGRATAALGKADKNEIAGVNVDNVRQAYAQLQGVMQKPFEAQNQAYVEQYTSAIQELDSAVKTLIGELSTVKPTLASASDVSKAKADFESLGKTWSKLFSNSSLSARYTDILGKFDTEMTQAQFKALQADVAAFRSEVIAAGAATQSFGGKLKSALGQFGSFLSVASLVGYAVKGMKDMYQAAVELDAKVTDLQIASGNARSEVRAMVNEYADMGKELGATAVDVATAADTFLRQGENEANTAKLIKDTLMLSKLGQIGTDESSTALTSAMKGYKMGADQAELIVDKLTAVDMEAAASAGGIAKAMAETATSADMAGISMDRLIGYITTIKEITQSGDEETGNFFKSTLARMSNIKAGYLSNPETGEDLSNVEATLSGLGIKLRNSNAEFRNFGDVLDEVSGKWDTFSSVQQRAIATALGGTRGQEKLLALIENYDSAMEYMNVAANSAGNASEKYNAYLDSIDAKTESFKATFQQLSADVVNSELVKGTLDTGTGILGFLDSVAKKAGTLGIIGTGAGITSIVKNVAGKNSDLLSVLQGVGISGEAGDVGQLAQSYMQLTNQQQRAYMWYSRLNQGAIALDASHRKELVSMVALIRQGKTFNITMAEAALKQKGLTTEQIAGLQSAMQHSGGLQSDTLALKENVNAVVEAALAGTSLDAQKKQEIANLILSKAQIDNETSSILKNVAARALMLAQDPMTWISVALVAIPMLVNWINNYTSALEKQNEVLSEASDAYATAKGDVESLQQAIAQNTSEIDDLDGNNSVDAEKIQNLRIENEELEKQLKLKQLIAQNEQGDLEQEFIASVNERQKRNRMVDSYSLSPSGTAILQERTNLDGTTDSVLFGDVSATNESLSSSGMSYDEIISIRQQSLEILKTKLSDLNQQYTDAIVENDEDAQNKIEQDISKTRGQIKTQEGYISSIADELSTSYTQIINAYGGINNVSDESLRDSLLKVQQWRDIALQLLGGSGRDDTAIQAIIDSDVYVKVVDDLKKLAAQGELTEDVLNSEEYSGLTNTLRNLGATIQYIIDLFNQLAGVDTADKQFVEPVSPIEAYTTRNTNDVNDALSKVIQEYNTDGVVAKDTLKDLEKVMPGVANLLLDQSGKWTTAGQSILGYTDNIKGATAELYRLLIAQKQQELAQLNPTSETYATDRDGIQNEIDTYQTALDNLRANWRDEIATALSSINSDSDILAQAINDLNDGTFEEWDSEFVDKLLDAFPDLADEIEAFADGTMDAKDLIEEMQDAADASAWDDFLEALDAVNSAVEKYGEDSYQVQEALENLESIVPGVSALFYTEDGALTDVGQAAILAADGHIDAAEAMLQSALVAAQLDLSNIVNEWNAVTQAADQAAIAGINASYSQQYNNASKKVADIKALLDNLGKKGLGGGGGSRRGGGGGGSSKKDVLEDYKNQKKILEHRADMSKAAQDLMQEDTDEWRAEQQKQYDIYREYAAMIQAEMERLRKLGYDSESEELMQLESDLAKVKKQMYSLQKEAWKSQQDAQIKALKKQKDAAKEAWEAEKERLEGEIDRQEALIGLLEKQYDLTNNLRDQRTDLAKQLASSKSYIGLSEEERKSLFSDEDYAQLMGVLDDIQREAIIAYNEYTEQIKSVNTDEAYKLDYITQQYEAQYELMNKKYAIAVQDLAVARARIALENAQQNRNIAMIVNGKWTWSADPQAIQDAVEKIYDAEQERADAQSDYIQQEKLNEMEGFKASLELEKEAAQKAYEDFVEHIDKLIEALEEMEFAFDETIENLYDVAGKIEGAGNAIASAAASAAAAISSAGGGGGGGGGGDVTDPGKETAFEKNAKDLGKKFISGIVDAVRKQKGGGNSGGAGGAHRTNVLMTFADGGVVSQTGPAMVHGSTRAPEVVFNATDAAKLYDIIHNGNPVAAMTDQIKAQVHNAAASMANAVPEALQPIQYIINGLKLGDESGNLTLRQFATQLSAAAPFLK